MNINENLKNKGNYNKKHTINKQISAHNHHQTTVLACFYIISDAN